MLSSHTSQILPSALTHLKLSYSFTHKLSFKSFEASDLSCSVITVVFTPPACKVSVTVMDTILRAACVGVMCSLFGMYEGKLQKNPGFSNKDLFISSSSVDLSIGNKSGVESDSKIENGVTVPLLTLLELSSNSLPVHHRVPRAVHRDKPPRRSRYRHSTRVLTLKPAPFLLPPHENEISKSKNEKNNLLNTKESESIPEKEKKPFIINVPFDESLNKVQTTDKSFDQIPTTTPVAIVSSKLPLNVTPPALILVPPYQDRYEVLRTGRKHSNFDQNILLKGNQRYNSEDFFDYFGGVKSHEVTEEPSRNSVTPTEETSVSHTNSWKSVGFDSTTENYVDNSTYENAWTQQPFFSEEPQSTTYNESPTELTPNENSTEIILPNVTEDFYEPFERDRTSNSYHNYTENKGDRYDIASNLLAPEVASMGMKVVGTKKGMEMVRQQWYDIAPRNKNKDVSSTTPDYTAQDYPENVQSDEGQDENLQLSAAETGDYRTKLFENFRQFTQSQDPVNLVIPGVAGVDYPTLSKPPVTVNKPCTSGVGYVADKRTGCQVFYICVGNGVGEPLLCPNGTLFSQDFLVCDWWYNVECI